MCQSLKHHQEACICQSGRIARAMLGTVPVEGHGCGAMEGGMAGRDHALDGHMLCSRRRRRGREEGRTVSAHAVGAPSQSRPRGKHGRRRRLEAARECGSGGDRKEGYGDDEGRRWRQEAGSRKQTAWGAQAVSMRATSRAKPGRACEAEIALRCPPRLVITSPSQHHVTPRAHLSNAARMT